MAISAVTRQRMLHRVGKVHEALIKLSSEYPQPFRIRAGIWPEEMLPYPRGLITQLLDEEDKDPVAGAALRGLSVEQWQETLRMLEMGLAHDFLPRDEWLERQAEMDQAMEQGERWLVERDKDSLA